MITSKSNEENPLWYKDAIIYQLHIRAFYDSNEDGIGDFQGLMQKLDYLSNLGVTAIWLLPFYPSPMKDDGYDIADYSNINPAYGTLDDFKQFLDEAHRRNIRVITELVINHTSDQHEWFQKSRRAPPGSYWRDFYVWSDTPAKYKGTRIIFKDFETSNWAWDPLAKSYYWHRFYSHQPDLNFDNPEVQKAVFQAFDFWMAMGVDGMRLDAVPYLFEREHTSCENLPETHEFLKKLRAHIDARFPGRMLLAEANQWPEDAVNYFGNGDECHMNFHFPLMPRLFMALKMEDRYSIIDILRQTPDIPDNCQWATFLRNHDELTLEMVTDEERDYMYKVYANDPRARINLGVRRRLAPLAGNDRRQIELLNSLLFSLPGSPIIYYGDEIGMGDNIYLGDRDGVRTPFQWSADRNAGFSRAHPQKLYLPVISTPEYHADSVNVENLRSNPTSLLWWMTKLIGLRSNYSELSRGKMEFLESTNPKVLSYVRQLGDRAIVCVANLSRNAQYVEIDLSRFKGHTPKELFGQMDFPVVGETSYVLTLGPYSFYWLEMSEAASLALDPNAKLPPIELGEDPFESLRERRYAAPFSRALRLYLDRSRWYAGKGRRISTIELTDSFQIPVADDEKTFLALIKVNYNEGLSDFYSLGFGHATGEKAQKMMMERPQIVIAETTKGAFYDAMGDAAFGAAVLDAIVKKKRINGDHARLRTEFLGDPNTVIPEPSVTGGEQSNSSLLFGKQLYLKFYRRIEEGDNPEIEIDRYLTEKGYKGTAPFLGSLSYQVGNTTASLAIVQQVLENESDGWSLIVGQVAQITERMLSENLAEKYPQIPRGPLSELLKLKPPQEYQDVAGYTLRLAHLLGARTAEMHLALGQEDRLANFIPEPYTPFYQRSLFQSFRNLADKTFTRLKGALPRLEGKTKEMAQQVLSLQSEIYHQFAPMKTMALEAMRIRIHGDYHLGQTLFSGQDFYIIDFEGEPVRGMGERKLKRTPLKDVAGMLRSFDYAAEFHMKKFVLREQDRTQVETCLHVWSAWMGLEFLNAYLEKVDGSGLVPADPAHFEVLLNMFILEKALYEIGYEVNSRPDWVGIPLRGVLSALGKDV